MKRKIAIAFQVIHCNNVLRKKMGRGKMIQIDLNKPL